MLAILAGVGRSYAAPAGSLSDTSSGEEPNVFITVDNPDAVMINVGWDGTELTLQAGQNSFYIEPYESVMITARDNYEIVDVQGEGVFGFDGIYSLLPEEGVIYDITITTRKLAVECFSLDVDVASRIEAKYVGKTLSLQDGVNEIEIVDMATLTLKALEGFRIVEASGFDYDAASGTWSRYITVDDANMVFSITTEPYQEGALYASLDVLSDPAMFDLYVGDRMVDVVAGLQQLQFTETKNNCRITLHSGVCQRADVLLNGVRQNVVSNEISFNLSEGDIVSIELFEQTDLRQITVNVDDPAHIVARDGLSGILLELQAGDNYLDCSDYRVYEFRPAQDCEIVEANGGFATNDSDPDCRSLILNGNESGNSYSIVSNSVAPEYYHATLRVSEPEKIRVIRIGTNYFEATEGDIALSWVAGGLNQLYVGINLEPTVLAVLTVNGEVVSGDEWIDYFYVMLEDGDLVEIDFVPYDLYFDVTLEADGPREGFEVYSGETLLEGDTFHLLNESEITIVPVEGYKITSVKVDGVSLDMEEDGSYIYPAVTANHEIVVRLYKEYYVNAVDASDGSIEVFIIEEESGDLTKSITAREGDSIYLYHQEADGITFKCFTINGTELTGNTFNVAPELAGDDGHTIVVSAEQEAAGVSAVYGAENQAIRVFTLSGTEVNPNRPLAPGIYVMKTSEGVKKIVVN